MPTAPIAPTNASEPTSITEIKEVSVESPFDINDNEDPVPTPLPEQAQEPQDNAQADAQPLPQRSTCTCIPTTKASPDNPPITCLELAVQESCTAGDRLHATQAKQHQ
ncbi:hypothetical protein C0993_006765, partial [Termitomyces sp. T159_Od127]